MDRGQLDKLIDTVDAILKPRGFECVEAEWVGASRVLRLFVDVLSAPDVRDIKDIDDERARPDTSYENRSLPRGTQGIDLDGCVAATRLLDGVEALEDMIPGAYTLEVSSPGLERPLRRLNCFRRHLGEQVKVALSPAVTGRRRGVGRLVSVDERSMDNNEAPQIALETDEGPWSFPLTSLHKASLVHEWDNGARHA